MRHYRWRERRDIWSETIALEEMLSWTVKWLKKQGILKLS